MTTPFVHKKVSKKTKLVNDNFSGSLFNGKTFDTNKILSLQKKSTKVGNGLKITLTDKEIVSEVISIQAWILDNNNEYVLHTSGKSGVPYYNPLYKKMFVTKPLLYNSSDGYGDFEISSIASFLEICSEIIFKWIIRNHF